MAFKVPPKSEIIFFGGHLYSIVAPFNIEVYIVKLQCFCQSEAVDVRCPVITITHANSVVSGF